MCCACVRCVCCMCTPWTSLCCLLLSFATLPPHRSPLTAHRAHTHLTSHVSHSLTSPHLQSDWRRDNAYKRAAQRYGLLIGPGADAINLTGGMEGGMAATAPPDLRLPGAGGPISARVRRRRRRLPSSHSSRMKAASKQLLSGRREHHRSGWRRIGWSGVVCIRSHVHAVAHRLVAHRRSDDGGGRADGDGSLVARFRN